MKLAETTRLADILETYPWLSGTLGETVPGAKPFLALMNSPLGRNALKTATVADAAAYLGRPAGRLLSRLEDVIREHGQAARD